MIMYPKIKIDCLIWFITYYKDTMSYYERMKKGHLKIIENNIMMKSLLNKMVDNYDNFLNSLNEITEETTETRDIGVNTDDIDDEIYISNDKEDEKQGVYSYIKHIVKNDGININGGLHKWRKHKKYGYICLIDLKELYMDYKKYTNEFNYKVKDYDGFILAFTYTYQGILKVRDSKSNIMMRFDKDLADKL